MAAFKEHEALAQLVAEQGIQHYRDDHPVTNRQGDPLLWVMNMLGVTLEAEGLALAARGMLHLLERFEGRQIATMGSAAAPLLSACVLLSQGRYNGLLVRTERKGYGTCNLIDGVVRKDEPVIVIDDSIGSGSNFVKCIEHLESEGLRVEGAACLVRVHWYTGYPALLDRGYQLEHLLDRKRDIDPRIPKSQLNEPEYSWQSHWSWHPMPAPEQLAPLALVREVMRTYISTGMVLRVPERTLYTEPSEGGVWISLRSATDAHQRFARGGYIRFPEQAPLSFAEALVRAAALTARQLAEREDALACIEHSQIAITCYGALEPCQIRDLDHQRWGVVVRSLVREDTCGGALPRVPGIVNAWQQFEHARSTNAQLRIYEPHECFRHPVYRICDPQYGKDAGGDPLPSAAQWQRDPEHGGQIARYLHRLLQQALGLATHAPSLDCALPPTLNMLFLSLYQDGQMLGCIGSRDCHSAAGLVSLVELLFGDMQRRGLAELAPQQPFALKVHLLTEPRDLGSFSSATELPMFNLGQEALGIRHGHKFALITADVPVAEHFDCAALCAEVIDKAGVTRAPYQWSAWEDHIWWLGADDEAPVYLASQVLPHTEPPPEVAALGGQWRDYVQRQCQELPRLHLDYWPFKHQLSRAADAAEGAELAYILSQVADEQALAPLEAYLHHWQTQTSEALEQSPETFVQSREQLQQLSFMSMLWCEIDLSGARQQGAPYAEAIAAAFDRHGQLRFGLPSGLDPAHCMWQDPTPGIALLALGTLQQKGVHSAPDALLERSLRHYRQRAQALRRIGPCHWLMQAFALWSQARQDPSLAVVITQYAEYALDAQQPDGGCLNLSQRLGAGSSTAWEAVIFAVAAGQSTDAPERKKWRQACHRALVFLHHLSLDLRYAPMLENPAYANGGIMSAPLDARVDCQHVAAAALAAHLYNRVEVSA